MMMSKKKVITLYWDGKWVNSNQELRSGSFNDGFYLSIAFGSLERQVNLPCPIKLISWKFL